MKSLRLIAFLASSLLALTGCSQVQATRWHEGSGKIKIVASTDVWGSIAHLIAGDLATVDAIIYNVNQDPHSYELSARDQLLINNADIVVMNGGGYDDFMNQAVKADPTPAITVDAFQSTGDNPNRNEHIWYDVNQVGDAAAVIGAAIESVEPSKTSQVEAAVADFRQKISERKAQLESLAATPKKVFLTEPLVGYLVKTAGYRNVTPAAFSRAVEEGRDIPPATLREATSLIKSGNVDAIFINSSTQTAQVNQLLSVNNKVPNYGFSELLPHDPDTLKYSGGYFEMLDASIKMLEGK